jgi:hypothetical protein
VPSFVRCMIVGELKKNKLSNLRERVSLLVSISIEKEIAKREGAYNVAPNSAGGRRGEATANQNPASNEATMLRAGLMRAL